MLNLRYGKFYSVSTCLHNNGNKIKRNFPLLAKGFISEGRTRSVLTHSTSLRSPTICKTWLFLYQKTGDFNKTNQTQRPSLHGDEVKFSSCGTSEDPLAAAHAHRAEGCSSDQFNSPGIQQQTNSLCENLFVIDTKTDYTTEWTLGKLWVVLCCSSSPILIHIHLGKILDRLLTNLKQHRSWYNT